MKQTLTLALLLMAAVAFSQNVAECGLDKTPVLTSNESQFLQRYLQKVAGDFDFSNKKIAFVSGNSGKTISDKATYFNEIKARTEDGNTVSSQVVLLTPEEKLASGGYDAIITTWVKIFSNGTKKKIIKKLGKNY